MVVCNQAAVLVSPKRVRNAVFHLAKLADKLNKSHISIWYVHVCMIVSLCTYQHLTHRDPTIWVVSSSDVGIDISRLVIKGCGNHTKCCGPHVVFLKIF
jgi:hypothetical protein